MTLNIFKILNAKKLTWIFTILAVFSIAGAGYEINRIRQIQAFNEAILNAKSPKTDMQSFEAKFATAYWLAKNERYKESTLLYTNLLAHANNKQKEAIQHNLGTIFFHRGLAINGTNMTVGKETEYLLRQAKNLYQQAVRLDNSHWDSRHNLDRLILLLPGTPTPGVGESDSPGLIMGNIPVGLP
jgi:mxaK protein